VASEKNVTDCANNDSPSFSLVLSKSRYRRHHDGSGSKPLLMDYNRSGCLDLGVASTGSIRRCSRSNFQRRSFRLGGRRGLARGQSVAPLSWGVCAVLWTLDAPPLAFQRSPIIFDAFLKEAPTKSSVRPRRASGDGVVSPATPIGSQGTVRAGAPIHASIRRCAPIVP
jgi:hypothetical protein